jgi:hypothetical protein
MDRMMRDAGGVHDRPAVGDRAAAIRPAVGVAPAPLSGG